MVYWQTEWQPRTVPLPRYFTKTREDERLTINSLLQHFVNVWADFAK